jgi:hypothetical protein
MDGHPMIGWLYHRITPHKSALDDCWFGVGAVRARPPGNAVVGVSFQFGKRCIAFHRKLT